MISGREPAVQQTVRVYTVRLFFFCACFLHFACFAGFCLFSLFCLFCLFCMRVCVFLLMCFCFVCFCLWLLSFVFLPFVFRRLPVVPCCVPVVSCLLQFAFRLFLQFWFSFLLYPCLFLVFLGLSVLCFFCPCPCPFPLHLPFLFVVPIFTVLPFYVHSICFQLFFAFCFLLLSLALVLLSAWL